MWLIVASYQVGDTTPLELGWLPVTLPHTDSNQAETEKKFNENKNNKNADYDQIGWDNVYAIKIRSLEYPWCAKGRMNNKEKKQVLKPFTFFLENLRIPGAKKNLIASIVFGKEALLQ